MPFKAERELDGKTKKLFVLSSGKKIIFFLVMVLFLYPLLGITGHKDRSQIKVCSLYQKF